MGGGEGAGGYTTAQNSDWLLYGFQSELKARGLGATIPSAFRIKSMRSFKAYGPKSEKIREALELAVPDLSMPEQVALGIIVARALANYISAWTELSLESMLHNVGRTMEALDSAFPGYLDAGMLGHLLKSKRTNLGAE